MCGLYYAIYLNFSLDTWEIVALTCDPMANHYCDSLSIGVELEDTIILVKGKANVNFIAFTER